MLCAPAGAGGATRDAFFADFTASEPGPTSLDTLKVTTPMPGANGVGRGRRPSIWIKEEERCKKLELVGVIGSFGAVPRVGRIVERIAGLAPDPVERRAALVEHGLDRGSPGLARVAVRLDD